MNDYQDMQQPVPGLNPDAEMEALEEQPSKWRVFVREIIDTLVLAFVLFVIINALTARVRVDGPSMEPSFFHNNRVVVSKISYYLGDIQRGDVIVFPAPPNPDEDYIKRVIGLPGDEVRVSGGTVYVNGDALAEPYIAAPPISEMRPMIVPEGQVFVMGDNRNVSSDSRSWGPLQVEDIIGKAVFVYWPFDRVHLVKHYELGGG
ncbi:MAG TPA: signal peptidase I [Anaerolineales bacterium]|nr:signal peptidase I [Anaerolineales bacterium]